MARAARGKRTESKSRTPKVIVSFFVKEAVFRQVGILTGKLNDKGDDFVPFHTSKAGLEFGYVPGEWFRAYGKTLTPALLSDVKKVMGHIHGLFGVEPSKQPVFLTVNGGTDADVVLLARFGFRWDEHQSVFRLKPLVLK
jgi:hypothetical protein